ncbi:MAG: FtsX-like permease family protein [Chloroflexi bacterium]|nr:FtsX-like permease family protein [Chloroflexota bacterium]
MDSMFGLSMNLIMFVLLGLLAITLGAILLIFLRNRIVFLMGLRNIPRRIAQSTLIVIGLMLSTVIITAAFTFGDTVDYSITKATFDLFGHADIILERQIGQRADELPGEDEISNSEYEQFLAAADVASLENVDGYMGLLWEPVPVINAETGLSEPDVLFTGIDVGQAGAFPDVIDVETGESLSVTDLGTDEVYLNESAADELRAVAGSVITAFVKSEPRDYTVRAVVEDRAVTGALDASSPEGMVASLETVQELFGSDQVSIILVSVSGGVRDTLDAIPAVEAEIVRFTFAESIPLQVETTKVESVDDAEEIGNFMTTFFLLLGLFSIGAGVLLIVMIFVMLAAERKSEMGMARAIGMKRRHLVEMFLAEGTGYNLASAVVGVSVGVAVAFALTTAASAIFESLGFTFTPHVTLRTIVISYCLGVVLTFLTVTFSSWRVSTLNIVSAIRDTPEYSNKRMGWRGITAWTLLIAASVYLVYLGLQSDIAFPFALGVTLITVGATVFATYFGAPARPAYTAMSLFLLLFWGFTAGDRLQWLFGTLDGDIEMFFLSGVAMVTASTFFIIYNLDILLAFLSRAGGAFGSILPSLRTAVAYPMADRFRTGMTLAMISLVVFSLTTMSAMNLNYEKLFAQDESRGGWDVQVVENPNNPMATVRDALLLAGDPIADEIEAEGAVQIAGFGDASEVCQGDCPAVPPSPGSPGGEFDSYPVQGLTNGFIENGDVPLDKIANGYEDADAVWDALQSEPDVAIIDAFAIEGGFGPHEFSLDGIPTQEDTFEAPVIVVRDSASGITRSLRVIGVIEFGASANFPGIFMGPEAFRGVFGLPELSVHFVALTNPDDSRELARDIEAALVTTGAQADSLEEIAEGNSALSRNFLYLMQAFMGLGLVVGVAGIGVIAFRTVVERRQQIGMLRAIGYKKSMVSLSFMMESSFVTVLGVISGTGLGLWLAYFLVTSDDFPSEGGNFYVPWLQIVLIGGVTIFASLLMTIIPSQQAASVPTAEALRYE